MIRTLIAEDEPLAREALRLRLQSEPDIEIVGEAVDGRSAVELVLRLRPDLLLLDVQMPGMSGFAVLETIAATHLPAVIFITADGEHAGHVNAIDALVERYRAERFVQSLARARAAIANGDESLQQRQDVADAVHDPQHVDAGAAPRYVQRIALRERHRFVLIKVQDIDFITAAGNYVRIHTGSRSALYRSSLADLERKLDPSMFARIHRSTIVNVDRIAEIRPDSAGDFEVQLLSDESVRMSRSYRGALLP